MCIEMISANRNGTERNDTEVPHNFIDSFQFNLIRCVKN